MRSAEVAVIITAPLGGRINGSIAKDERINIILPNLNLTLSSNPNPNPNPQGDGLMFRPGSFDACI
eukprot:1340766-Amorphochlora_amoeboformis.AAC.1